MHDWALIDHYAQYHRRWFESPARYVPTGEHLRAYRDGMPESWNLERSGLWYVASPPGTLLPDQGWKLHISVRAEESIACLRRAQQVLRAEATPFKFLLDTHTVTLVNSKLWPRASSGKFITAYPYTHEQFMQLGELLARELHDFVGPYVLSDRRWPGSLCVYYRYGGFRRRPILQIDGTTKFAISAPDGAPVPDTRKPYWSPPDWVTDPFPSIRKMDDASLVLNKGRFTVVSALKFSNRGGVYKGVDNHTGRQVVIKESRPHVTVGRHAVDAIDVLEKEYRLLTQLDRTGYFVTPVTCFRQDEHAFLVEEFVAGNHLGQFTIGRNPLYQGPVTATGLEHYFQDIRQLWLQLARAIGSAHELGIVLGDLSFANVVVTGSARVRLLDLECAVEEGVDPQVGLHTPGLAAPHTLQSGISDRANDYYALGAIIFGSIMLATGISGFYPPSRGRFLRELRVDLALPDELIGLIEALMAPPTDDGPGCRIPGAIAELPDTIGNTSVRVPRLEQSAVQRLQRDNRPDLWHRVVKTRDGVVDYLLGTADVDRDDRLFPADLSVFETNPLSVSFGAAGVLYALQRITGDVPERLLRWMLNRQINNDEVPPGLYGGQAGIAWVLGEIGYPDASVSIMRSARRHDLLWHLPNVLHGAAGYGLACLKLWASGLGEEFLADAVGVGEYLLGSVVRDEHGARWRDVDGAVPLGYAYGGSGMSLFLLYLHQATQDSATLDLAREALDFELLHGVFRNGLFSGFPAEVVDDSDGVDVVPRGYWDAGSAGVATTLIRHYAVTSDLILLPWVDYLASNLSHKYAAFPQLFHGLSGLGNALLDIWEICDDERYLSEAWQVAEGILLFRIDRPEGIGFAGEQAIRESADFATGAAGIGLFLDRLVKAEAGTQGNFNFVVDELLPPRLLEAEASADENSYL